MGLKEYDICYTMTFIYNGRDEKESPLSTGNDLGDLLNKKTGRRSIGSFTPRHGSLTKIPTFKEAAHAIEDNPDYNNE